MPFQERGTSAIHGRELATGFFVTVSDRELLAKVQALMNKQGYLGFMDTAGRLNYWVDGRRNMYQAVHTISRLRPLERSVLAEQEALTDPEHLSQLSLLLLGRHGFSANHKGSQVLKFVLPLAYQNEEKISPLSKFLYPAAASHFCMRVQQVDRVIRYASLSSALKLRNSELINQLLAELHELLQGKNSGEIRRPEGFQGH